MKKHCRESCATSLSRPTGTASRSDRFRRGFASTTTFRIRNSWLPNSRRTDHAFGSCPREADRYETGGRLVGLTLSTELARHYMCVPIGWENTSGTNTALGSRIALRNAASESRPHRGDSADGPSRCDRWTSEPCFPRGSDRLGFTGMYTRCARKSVTPASVLLP